MENENRYASKGVGGAALGIGIGALGTQVLNGSLGNLFNGGGGCGNNQYINRYEMELQQQLAAKDSRIGLLESNIYADSKIADVYERLNTKFESRLACIEAQINQQNVINAQITANLACQQTSINTFSGLLKTVVPISSVCPEPMPAYNSWTAPTTAA